MCCVAKSRQARDNIPSGRQEPKAVKMHLSLSLLALHGVSMAAGTTLKPWVSKSKQPCKDFVEDCVGTEVWCKSFVNGRSPYASPEACFRDRAAEAQTKHLLAGSENRTDAACETIQDLVGRMECYAAREMGPWLPLASQACPDGTRDESCLDLDDWCKSAKAKFIYGSTEVCQGFRKLASLKQPGGQGKFRGDHGEDYQRTESLCGALVDGEERLRCFSQRTRGPFAVVYSAACSEHQTYELCNGTVDWCRQSSSLALYGSETNCRNFRGEPPELLKWQPKADNCSDASEQCLGTEQVCNTLVPTDLRDDCFVARESPPFLPADPRSCSDDKPASEMCLGTEAWCTDHFQQANYLTADKCLSIRGWDLDKVETQVGDDLAKSLDRILAATLIEMTRLKSSLEEAKPAFKEILEWIRKNSTALAASAAEEAYELPIYLYLWQLSHGGKLTTIANYIPTGGEVNPSLGPTGNHQVSTTISMDIVFHFISMANMALRGRRYILLATAIAAVMVLFLTREPALAKARHLISTATTISTTSTTTSTGKATSYLPEPDWNPPPIREPFPRLKAAGASPPQVPAWNRPKSKIHNEYGLDYAPPLLIGFSRAWPVLLQAIVSYITAGWPAEQIWVVENTGGAARANAEARLTLQNPLYVDHDMLRRLGVRIVAAPVLMTFAQLQNYFTHLAHENDWPFYFWSHMDVLVLSYEDGLDGLTPPAGDKAYRSVYELCLAELERRRREPIRWSNVFFSYDHLSLVNREAYDDVGGWDVYIPFYMNDCDMHSRLMMRNWTQRDGRAGIITDVSTVLDDLGALYRDPAIEPSFSDPNPPEPGKAPIEARDEANTTAITPETAYFQKLKAVADHMFHYKHGDRGRNTWQLGQHGGQGEPFYYPARGIAEATELLTEAGREVFRRKWGHRDCDLIAGAGRKYDDQWRVAKDWE
ncbi:hypothetical protein L249_1257 [Ophiocordyceps polyrhachis-furcata BCC 54312]|uniref:Uncharacterized protein n=1 Tax=Ophiocordyceps polyrhachis-furcata BCC 54312 TaxID=1330021 RepID=A0A367LE50_9HYPO|nr:hypothetical protein L249_1257 [Ophiocordyceps polyrhachis-furcata BCC 54312]